MKLLPQIIPTSESNDPPSLGSVRVVLDASEELGQLEAQLQKSRKKFKDLGRELRKQTLKTPLEKAGPLKRGKLLRLCQKTQIQYMKYLQDRVNMARATGEKFLDGNKIAASLLPQDTEAFRIEYLVHRSQKKWREAWLTLVQAHRWSKASWVQEEMSHIAEQLPERQRKEIQGLVYLT